jgi:hypothetical protein
MICGGIFLMLVGCDDKNGPEAGDTGITAFTDVNVVAMTDEDIVANQTVVVEEGVIVEIGPADQVDVPGNATVVDGEGLYLMPGLADMHIHTREHWLDGSWPVSPLLLFLANGVTTVRDMGPDYEDPTYVLDLRDEIETGTLIGPRIYATGRRPGRPWEAGQFPNQIVQYNADQGFDFLKIYSYMSQGDFHTVMTNAQTEVMYVAGHIPFPVGLETVLSEGMHEIAHVEELLWEFVEFNRDTSLAWQAWLPYVIGSVLAQHDITAGFNRAEVEVRYGQRLADVMSDLAAGNIAVSTTMVVDEGIVQKLFTLSAFMSRPEMQYMPQAYINSLHQGTEKHQGQFQGIEDLGPYKYGMDKMLLSELHLAGVPLLLATDAGTADMGIVPGFSIHDELRLLVENGLTPYEAIAAGTVEAARVVEAITGEGEFGTIEEGQRGDLILVGENPLDDVAYIKDHLGVMAAGRWYDRATLDEMIALGE